MRVTARQASAVIVVAVRSYRRLSGFCRTAASQGCDRRLSGAHPRLRRQAARLRHRATQQRPVPQAEPAMGTLHAVSVAAAGRPRESASGHVEDLRTAVASVPGRSPHAARPCWRTDAGLRPQVGPLGVEGPVVCVPAPGSAGSGQPATGPGHVTGGQGVAGSHPVSPTVEPQVRGGSAERAGPPPA